MTDKPTHTPLPCPFCGSGVALKPGRYTQAAFSGVEMQTLGEGCHQVWCGTCGAQGSTEATEAEALTAWNTRAVNSHHDLIEALRGVMDILGRAESNASGNPEWDYVGPRVAKARAILTKAEAGHG